MSKRSLLDSDEEEGGASSRPPPSKVKKEKKEKTSKHEKSSSKEPQLKVNTDFAKKYQEKKKKEELTRRAYQTLFYLFVLVYFLLHLKLLSCCSYNAISVREQFGSDASSSDSESEDEDGELLDKNIEDEFYKIIPMIASKDKRIYDPKVSFFHEGEGAEEKEGDDEDEKKKESKKDTKKKKEQPLHVSDYLRERLLKLGPEDAEKSDEVLPPPFLFYVVLMILG